MKEISEKIASLIQEGEGVKDAFDGGSHLTDKQRQVLFRQNQRWISNSKAVLKYLSEEHYKEFIRIEDAKYYEAAKVAMQIGVLESTLDSIQLGLFGKIKHLVHADMFGNILDQAEELHKAGHQVPAAVLARIVIENWLRDESERQGIPHYDTAKASLLNDELKKREVISVPKWRLIQSMLDVGNAAAHGKESEFTPVDVNRMIQYGRDNCV